jgi:hypothetical protein
VSRNSNLLFLLEDHGCIGALCRKAHTIEAELSDLLIGIIAPERGCATTMIFDKKAFPFGVLYAD